MSDRFIGSTVLATLNDQSTVQGVLLDIDQVQGTITFVDVTIDQGGYVSQWPRKLLERKNVASLKIISRRRVSVAAAASSSSPAAASPPIPAAAIDVPEVFSESRNASSDRQRQRMAEANGTMENENEDANGNGNGIDESRKAKCAKRRAYKGKGVAIQLQPQYVEEEVAQEEDYNHANGKIHQQEQEDEFDFGAGLLKFDKRAIFDQIRDQDDTDPALRLHSHNRNPARKLGINESVLSQAELDDQQLIRSSLVDRSLKAHQYQQQESKMDVAVDVEGAPAKAKRPLQQPIASTSTSTSTSTPVPSASSHSKTGFVTCASHVPLIDIKLKQYNQVLSFADRSSDGFTAVGPTALERIENAGRGIAEVILGHIPGTRFEEETKDAGSGRSRTTRKKVKKSICIFVRDCEKALAAMRAGVHLLNRGFKVVCFSAAGEEDTTEAFRNGIRAFSLGGGRVVRDLEDLSASYSLIIEALSNNETQNTFSKLQKSEMQHLLQLVTPVLDYISSAAPSSSLLTIDSPFGIDHDTSLPLSPLLPASPTPLSATYLVCLGAIRKGARRAAAAPSTGIFLVDVGISPALWRRAGIDDEEWDEDVWGSGFVTECERAV